MKGKWNEWLPRIVSNPNWRQGWFLASFLAFAWIGLAELIPDQYFKPTAIVLVWFQSLTTFIMRGGKYVVDRESEIPDGLLVTPPTIPSGKQPVGTSGPNI